MTGKAVRYIEKIPISMGIRKAAIYFDKVISPISTYTAYVGSAVLGFLVLMLIYSIIGRRFFDTPLKGSFEMTELCLVAIAFTLLAYHCLNHEVMTVEVIERHFPQRFREILEVVIRFLTISMLMVLCWQLIVQGIRVQGFHQTTRVLQIPIYPFLYLAALGTFLLANVYVKHFLYSLDRVVNK